MFFQRFDDSWPGTSSFHVMFHFIIGICESSTKVLDQVFMFWDSVGGLGMVVSTI